MVEEQRFVKKGNVIVLKESIPDKEFSSKQILDNIDQISGMITKGGGDVTKKGQEIEQINKEVARISIILKQIKKFEDWAVEVQLSKIKALWDKLGSELITKINTEYKEDQTLTLEGNKAQKMAMLQNSFGRHQEVATEISPRFIKSEIYNGDLITNPWA